MLLQFVPSAGSLGRGCYKKQRGDVEQCRHPLVIRGDCSDREAALRRRCYFNAESDRMLQIKERRMSRR